MFKYLRCIFEILLGILVIFVGAVLALSGENILIGLIKIAIGIFICCIAAKNSPRNINKQSKLKFTSGKRAIVVLSCLIASFIFFIIAFSSSDYTDADAPHSTSSETEAASTSMLEETFTSSDSLKESDVTIVEPSTTEETTEETTQEKTTEATTTEATTTEATTAATIFYTEPTTYRNNLGEYDVTIKKYYKTEGFYDEELLVIVYTFTNNSNNTISFSDAIEDKLFQNGVELDLYIAANIQGQVDIRDSFKELQPGASFDVPRAYVLNFDTPSTINIEVKKEDGTGETLQCTFEIE